MTDVLKDFAVVLATEDGRIRTLRPEAFRLAARCPSTLVPARKR